MARCNSLLTSVFLETVRRGREGGKPKHRAWRNVLQGR